MPVITEKIITQTDTVIVYKEAKTKIVYRDRVAERTDNVFTATFDTTIVIESDSITIEQEVSFNEVSSTFTQAMEVSYRKMERTLIDSIFVDKVREVKVYTNPPFYNTFVFGSVFSFIILAIMVIFL